MKESSQPDFSPVYLRLSVTDRCNLRCRYCRPSQGGPPPGRHQSSVGHPQVPPIVRASDTELLGLVALLSQQCPIYKLRLTGGEPLMRPDLVGLVSRLRRAMPETELCMTTNGIRLSRHAAALCRAGLQALNVSLDTTDAAAFAELTRGGRVEATIEGIRASRRAGFQRITLNAVLLRHFNGDHLVDLVRFAAEEECEIRFIELMPFGEAARLHETEFLSASEALDRLAEPFEYLGPAADTPTARRHRLLVDGSESTIGFITTMSRPFCGDCDRIRLDCRGHLFSCLRSKSGVDLLTPWRAGQIDVVHQRIRQGIVNQHTPKADWPDRNMVSLGG